MRIALCDDDEAQREKLKAAVDRHLVSRGYRPRYEEYSGGYEWFFRRQTYKRV